MAVVMTERRETLEAKCAPYKKMIDDELDNEKKMNALMEHDNAGLSYKRLTLAEKMIGVATCYITMNSLSVEILSTKNNEALNEARKTLYKAIIYLEDTVSGITDVPFSEIEGRLSEIANIPVEKRYYLVRKLGLAIRLLIDAFGENTKWKWSFVELQGRFATVAKNLIDMKKAAKDYFDPNSPDYDNTVLYIRLVKKLLDESATGYRDRYELSTHRIDDMRSAISYLAALRRISLVIGNSDEAEEIKKKAVVWHDKLVGDTKSGLAK